MSDCVEDIVRVGALLHEDAARAIELLPESGGLKATNRPEWFCGS